MIAYEQAAVAFSMAMVLLGIIGTIMTLVAGAVTGIGFALSFVAGRLVDYGLGVMKEKNEKFNLMYLQ
ncbi:MAG: hypothetical protein AB1810_14760 [Pseudomonadota bacterium]